MIADADSSIVSGELPSLDSPVAAAFLASNQLPPSAGHRTLKAWWEAQSWEFRADSGWDLPRLVDGLAAFAGAESTCSSMERLVSLSVLAGRAKDGAPERFDLHFHPGDVICLVGPTGAGKSRFLADIECFAQGDTPSGRRILLDGRTVPAAVRFDGEARIVAQITQNMNFVMDLPVGEFLKMHAESRALKDADAALQRVLEAAVSMAGEPFAASTPLTQLSGGQARSLMIADAAFLSPKPVVLIDEIENAGVDRTRALRLFVDQGKIVLLSTHDPLLALSGGRRLIFKNGAVHEVVESSPEESANREALAQLDLRLSRLRERIRRGERLGETWGALMQ